MKKSYPDLTHQFEWDSGSATMGRHGHPRETLLPFNNADRYLVERAIELLDTSLNPKTLIVNDGFGAIATALFHLGPDVVLDSAHGQRALAANLTLNNRDTSQIDIMTRFELAERPTNIPYELVLMRLPKSSAELSAQLEVLRPHISSKTRFIAGAMAKKISNSTLEIFRALIGPAQCSLAKRKARLIEVLVSNHGATNEGNPNRSFMIKKSITGLMDDLDLMSIAGTFSHGKLDQGTQVLLESLKLPTPCGHILDLGCGSGVLGIIAGLKVQDANLSFVDDSAAAIESTRRNLSRLERTNHRLSASLLHQDTLNGIADNSQCLVLNNPPFHDANARTSQTARIMFKEAKRVLRDGGELWVVGNRHLRYDLELRRLFGACENVGKHPRFVVLRAEKN